MDKDKSETLLIDAHILAEHIVNALDCIGQVDAMRKVLSMEKHKDTYRSAAHFFITAYQAMIYRYQLEITKLFDEDSDVISFSRFKKTLKKGKYIDTSYLVRYKAQYKRAKTDLDSIRFRRNNILSHANYTVSRDIMTFQKEHRFSLKELQKLLQIMLDICNVFILKHTEGVADLFSCAGNDDFLRLFGYEVAAEKTLLERLGGDVQ